MIFYRNIAPRGAAKYGATIGTWTTDAEKERAGIKVTDNRKINTDGTARAGAAKPTRRQVRVVKNLPATPREATARAEVAQVQELPKNILPGARALDATFDFLGHYVDWPDKVKMDNGEEISFAQVLATLYVAGTHFRDDDDKPLFAAWARWLLIGPKGSGKNRAMKAMHSLVFQPTPIAFSYTQFGVRDALHNNMTPFLDEYHKKVNTGKANQQTQATVLGSYSDEAGTLDGQGGYNEKDAFGPMVLAAQPQIVTNTNDMLDDLFERSFIIEIEKSYREDIPRLDQTFYSISEGLKDLLAMWAAQERPQPSNEDKHPKLWPLYGIPKGLEPRQAEISETLLSVADRAMAFEGDKRWAILARMAITDKFIGHGGTGQQIIKDVRARMVAKGFFGDGPQISNLDQRMSDLGMKI
jgi:hypothetical protein